MSVSAFIAGVVSALIVTVIVCWLKNIYSWGIVPFFQHLSYVGIKIEGTWETQLGGDDYTEKVELKRFGQKVWGTITVTSSPSNVDLKKEYQFKGYFKNNFLNCHYEIKDRSFFDCGNFVLQPKNGGGQLTGHSISYYDPDHTLESLEYTWNRIGTK